MKTKGLQLIVTGILLAGCTNDKVMHQEKRLTIEYSFPDVIPIDSANKMLGSYLNSVGYENNDTAIHSIIFNAALLRKYLDSVPGSGSIVNVKFMLAHKLSYINSGHINHNAGFNRDALTLIIAGYDVSGNYVLYPGDLAIDKGMACPTNCPPLGAASNPLFPILMSKP